jgi:hypothetical protein
MVPPKGVYCSNWKMLISSFVKNRDARSIYTFHTFVFRSYIEEYENASHFIRQGHFNTPKIAVQA